MLAAASSAWALPALGRLTATEKNTTVSTPGPAASGDWPCYRGAPSLLGRSEIKGDIRQPRVTSRYFVGAKQTDYLLLPPRENLGPPESYQAMMNPADPRWGMSPPKGEVAGALVSIAPSSTTVYASILPGYAGLQKVEFQSGFSLPTVKGQWAKAGARCLGWREGRWQVIWEMEPMDLLFSPMPLAGDFDGDGDLEIAFLPWNELVLLDAKTGRIKDRCRFTPGRSYGSFFARDLDGDGRIEFVVMADFCKHIDVLGWKDGKLSLLWQREIELTLERPQKILKVHPRCLADVNGDGRPELLASIFNESGDRRWHLLAFSAMTGKTLADLPDHYLQGVNDVDGDGAAEILLTSCEAQAPLRWPEISVWSLREKKPRRVWRMKAARWETWNVPARPDANIGAEGGYTDVLLRRMEAHAAVVIRNPGRDRRDRLGLFFWNRNGFDRLSEADGEALKVISFDEQGRLFTRAVYFQDQKEPIKARRGRLVAGASREVGFPGHTMPVVIRQPGRANPLIVVEAPEDQLLGLHSPVLAEGGVKALPLWRRDGRGAGWQWPEDYGVASADLDGDGACEIVYASASKDNRACVTALGTDGRERWRHDFPGLPGGPPIWNNGGIIMLQTGRFTNTSRNDVLVTFRKSIMHTEQTLVLSGQDGRQLWLRDKQISQRGVGGTFFAIADYDGDGLDDIASFHPSIFYIMKGATGADLIAMDCKWDQVPVAGDIYWGQPVAGNFERPGQPSLYFHGGMRSMCGLVRPDGKLAWFDALDHNCIGYPAFGRFGGGSGGWQALGWGYDDGLRCYDVKTGAVDWRMSAPAEHAKLHSVAADLNGDGRDEALFLGGGTIYCIGWDGAQQAGTLVWKLDFPATLGPPGLADLGDGRLSILAVGADGWLYSVSS